MTIKKRILIWTLVVTLCVSLTPQIFALNKTANTDDSIIQVLEKTINSPNLNCDTLITKEASTEPLNGLSNKSTSFNHMLFNASSIQQGAVIGSDLKIRSVLFSFGNVNQKYNIGVYYGDVTTGTLVATSSDYYSISRGITNLTTTWKTAGERAGNYTAVCFTSYYYGGKWNVVADTIETCSLFLSAVNKPMQDLFFYSTRTSGAHSCMVLQKGASHKFSMMAYPLDCTDDHAYTLSTSDTSVAKISELGGFYTVTGVSPGTAVITATSASVRNTLTVIVTDDGQTHTHSYVSSVTKPTCTTRGYTTYTCFCGESYIVVGSYTNALGHAWDGGTVTTRPTLTSIGEMTYTCTRCGATRVERIPAIGETNPFTDVSANAYYYTPVLWAVSNEITSGTSATTFSPDAGCTRAQVVAFLWRAAGKPEPKQSSNPFTDVRDGQYYYNAVLWAVEHGITAGTSATTFSPDATCTRGQIVSFLWRYEGKPAANASNPFTDVKPGAYYEPAVLWAVANGVTAGTSATTFSPDATCTRAQVVSFLYRDLTK